MVAKINFTHEGISHYGIDGKLINTTYRYIAYPKDKVDTHVGYILNTHYLSRLGDKTKKMIENQITWAFESCGRKVLSITFDDKYKGSEYAPKILSNFSCIIAYT